MAEKGKLLKDSSPIPNGVQVDAHVPMPSVSAPMKNVPYRGADRTKAGVNSPANAKMGR